MSTNAERMPTDKILLIDDDRSFCRIMEKVAHKRSVPLVACHPGDKPGILTDHQFSLMVVDYDLGNIDGVQLIKPLADFSQPLPVIFISSSFRPQMMFKSLPKNVLGFMLKSDFYDEFLTALLDMWAARGAGSR